MEMEKSMTCDNGLHLKATELRLGLPGTEEIETQRPVGVKSNKRSALEMDNSLTTDKDEQECAPPTKTQVVGWPPVRSYRKNVFEQKKKETDGSRMYVKVSMDGAPYLRKVDLSVYKSYPELLNALQNMFKCSIGVYSEREGYNGSEHAPTYEDKDGDWMLVGDVPWEMFISSCKRLRIIKGSEAKGLGYL
ncbi:hypothetical protein LguiA_011561 [Lonicera macranthoides]